MTGFEDEDFIKACSELDTPAIDNWEFFTESHDVKIYRYYNESSGLYQYKIYGSLNVPVQTCVDVYMDLEYRKHWDSYVKELKEIEEDGKKGIYWQVKFPFMMSNRDYTYRREIRQVPHNDGTAHVILARADQFSSHPPRSGVIRVEDYIQSMAMEAVSDTVTKAYMNYYDNPGGMIPTWLINWGAKTGVPTFLQQMQKACNDYNNYLSKR